MTISSPFGAIAGQLLDSNGCVLSATEGDNARSANFDPEGDPWIRRNL